MEKDLHDIVSISKQGYGYIIDEERTNCFVNGF